MALDLHAAVALSLLPGVSRLRIAEAFRAASRQPGSDDGSGTCGEPSLETLIERLNFETKTVYDLAGKVRERARRALLRASENGIEPVPLCDSRYPTALASIADPPLVLWVRGNPVVLEQRSVAVVGSRCASPYAVEVALHLAGGLASRGVTVVSGLARGVDSAAHRGALACGRTVAVLGSGVDVIYPFEHDALAAAIMADGALVSELPPGTPPRQHHFPLRNRLISGLSLAVVIVEASERSGSLITARCGLEQGREVMAVPGNILTGRNRGSHALLKDGAKVVESVDDILEELGYATCAAKAIVLDGNLLKVDPLLDVMLPGEEYDLDMLIERSGLDGPKLLSRLLGHELQGRVTRVGGGRFVRTSGKC